MLSVALSFTLPRLHVMEHPALWCSDFPPDQKADPAIVWTAPAEFLVAGCWLLVPRYYLLVASKFQISNHKYQTMTKIQNSKLSYNLDEGTFNTVWSLNIGI